MRSLLLILVALAVTPVQAQRVFRATPVDEKQNARIDDLEKRFTSFEKKIDRMTAAFEKQAAEDLEQAINLNLDYKTKPAAEKQTAVSDETGPADDDNVLRDPVTYRQVLVPVNTSTSYGSNGGHVELAAAPSYGSSGGAVPLTTASYGSIGGYVTAASSAGYYAQSSSSLKARIRQARPSLSTRAQYAIVSPGYAKAHLREHGYSSQELAGLTTTEAVILHDLTHGGVIRPGQNYPQPVRTQTSMPAVTTVQRTYNRPLSSGTVSRSYSAGSACANGQCPTTAAPQRRGLFGFRR